MSEPTIIAHKQAQCPDQGVDCGGMCNRCCLAICSVCGGGEGSLTTHCPSEKMTYKRQEQVYKEGLNFTAEKGWHKPDVIADKYGRIWPEPLFEK